MAAPPRLTPHALAAELSRLPALQAAHSAQLDPVQLALAHVIASGQDAGELAAQLGGPQALQPTAAIAVSAPATATGTPPDWIARAVPFALAKETSARVVILDREPTALGGLERPAWSRALSPSAVYGPVTATGIAGHAATPKWILQFNFTETVEVVRSGVILCVVPTSIFHFGSPTQAVINAGSAWIAVNPFTTTAPAGSFAGITVQSGTITCDQPLTFTATTINVPASATITITLIPSPTPAGPAGFPAAVTAPGKISFTFPPAGTPTGAFDHCAATLYGEPIVCAPANTPVLYNADLKLLFLPGTPTPGVFAPKPSASTLFTITGKAHILGAGWALGVNVSTTPATLGTAANCGEFALVFSKGLTCAWSGSSRPETASAGVLLAQNNVAVFSVASAGAPGTRLQQHFKLWQDQDALQDHRFCQIVSTRVAGQALLYATSSAGEVIELTAAIDALLDRPLLATGARVAARFSTGTIGLIRNNAGNAIVVGSNAPLQTPTLQGQVAVFPLALDNALLDVGQPTALVLAARADANFNAQAGFFILTFNFLLVELYLPDPYTAAAVNLPGVRGNPTGAAVAADLAATGTLSALIKFSAPDAATLRLMDTAHIQPAAPPATEASSTAVPPFHFVKQPPILVIPPAAATKDLATSEVSAHAVSKPNPRPDPLPEPAPANPSGTTLIDVSTRASQLGVEVISNERYAQLYTIDGLSVRGPANLLPLTTLPAIAWEPMYNESTGDASVSNYDLLHPPNDGPNTQVRANSATLIPISPLQSLQAVLNAGVGGFEALLTLPFGMVGQLNSYTQNGTQLPNLTLVQPVFPSASTPTGSIYTGAWQISISAPNPAQPDPVLAGRTYLRTQTDDPRPGFSYGEQVLGVDVADIFSTRFNPDNDAIGTGVPLRRYDLTGYGASTLSEWTNTTPATTDVLKAFFHVLVGRTSHEVIQVQSLVYPWAIKVVRTITIDRLASGTIERYDSGWQAASDGLFQYPASTNINSKDIHPGLISGVINVKNIQQVGLPLTTIGSPDPGNPLLPGPIQVQPVTFDADVIIQPQHKVLQGGSTLRDLTGVPHICVPSKGITGFIGLAYEFHLSLLDMANFTALAGGAGGSINASLNVGGADSLLRATEFDATPVHDAVTGGIGIACSVIGLPKLSADGSWSMAARTASQAAPTALDPKKGVPLVQPNEAGSATLGTLIHYANPADIFRLASDPGKIFTPGTLPETLYGFLQATGTQSNLLSRPILTVGSNQLTLGDALNVAHAGALLGAIGDFPGIGQCLQFLGNELSTITNKLENLSLATTQSIDIPAAVRAKPIPLISTSLADVNLYFHWKNDDASSPVANVSIALGQPTDPSWSLDITRVAVGLIIPALNANPVLWIQGAFHADADSIPSFPGLKVVFDTPLDILATFFTILQDIASVLSPGGGSSAEAVHAHDDGDDDSAGLHVHFSDGKLSVSDIFNLGDIPLGPGTISDVSLEIGTTLNIIGLSIDFLVGIGKPDAPCHWIVDPLSGTICLQAGIQKNQVAILIQAGIGLGLSIDLGIASGSASITIAVQIQITGEVITLMLLLTGQAQVDVLGGLASAAITLTAGLGFSVDFPKQEIGLIGTASVGIHISICWVINISWSGSWTFQKELPLKQIA